MANNRCEFGIVRISEGLGGINLHQESGIYFKLEKAEKGLGGENAKACDVADCSD